MQILFSPTKQMDFEPELPALSRDFPLTVPRFSDEALRLNSLLKELGPRELGTLMKMSDKLADQTQSALRQFDCHPGKPALFSYSGTTFQALDAHTLSPKSLAFASDHLCILSGLYGLLSPFDRISPYRLEMKTTLAVGSSRNLTGFWKQRVTEALVEKSDPDDLILNLASGEYSKIIDRKTLADRMITFHFKEKASSGYRTVGMYAKTARGRMLRRILEENITDPEVLKLSPTHGYGFRNDLGDEKNWVFTRG